MSTTIVQISKFLSLVLRHQPETIGLQLDAQGWVSVDTLLQQMKAHGKSIDMPLLEKVVAENSKKRFAFNEDKTRIRASQGHSVEVELGYTPTTPPDLLYHGTAAPALQGIRQTGIQKGSRHHVHLSKDTPTATQVGSRHGKPILLTILAGKMFADGYAFFVSENGVWLTDHVPVQYVVFPDL